jgi:hypothetical protein
MEEALEQHWGVPDYLHSNYRQREIEVSSITWQCLKDMLTALEKLLIKQLEDVMSSNQLLLRTMPKDVTTYHEISVFDGPDLCL